MAKKYPHLSRVLKHLLFSRDMKPIDLARELDIPQPTIHRLVTGKSKRPYKSSLEPIADYFAITVDQLLGEKPIPNLESENKSVTTPKYTIQEIPVISWQELNHLEQAIAASQENIITTGHFSDKAFALTMSDSSMEPLFPKGSTLIFDPSIKAHDRSYVLTHLQDGNTHGFRQLLIDTSHHYLKPLNPDLTQFQMRILDKNDRILACLVESRLNHKPSQAEALLEGI